MPHIRLQAIEGQNHASLLPEAFRQPGLIREPYGHQFLVAMEEMGHRAFGDLDATLP
jgi:hypothetical protein